MRLLQNKLSLIIIFFLSLFQSEFAFGNSSLQTSADVFVLVGEVYEDDKLISGVTINIYIEDVKMTTLVTNAKGQFKLNLKHNTIYVLETLKESYIPEKVTLNTTVTTDILKNGGIGETYDFTISIFKDYPGLKTDAFSEPIVHYIFNSRMGWFFEPDARKSKMAVINTTASKIYQLKQKDYQKLKKDGDKALSKNDGETAYFNYAQALMLFPEDDYMRSKMSELIKDIKKEGMFDELYQKYIQTADEAYDKQDFDIAGNNYQNAKFLKPKDKYIKTRLELVKSNKERLYLEKRRTYEQFVASAKKDEEVKNYQNALGNYVSATKLFPNDAFVKARIISVNKIIKSQAAATTANPKN